MVFMVFRMQNSTNYLKLLVSVKFRTLSVVIAFCKKLRLSAIIIFNTDLSTFTTFLKSTARQNID